MNIATAEGTPQIIAINVGGLRQEEDPTVTAVLEVAPQVGLASQDRSQSLVVRQNQIANLSLAIPVRPKLKMRLDLYGKKPSVSLTMLMVLSMSSSCSIEALMSNGRTRSVLLRALRGIHADRSTQRDLSPPTLSQVAQFW